MSSETVPEGELVSIADIELGQAGLPLTESNSTSPTKIVITGHKSSSDINITRKRSAIDIPRKASTGSELLSASVVEDDATSHDDKSFTFSEGITSERAQELLAVYGLNELPETSIPKWYIFVSQLWQPMPCMIWLAIIIEAGIQNFIDMAILLAIQFANATIAFYEITKAGDAVNALKSSLQPKATCKRDGKWTEMSATLLVPGDCVLLASGSSIPADCRVNSGHIDVDQAALTGESLPVTFHQGESCKMGSTVVRGETEGTVEFTGANTFFGKTASLLGSTGEVSNMQKMLVRIVSYLVVLSTVLCVIVLIYTATIIPFAEALSFVVVLLVASIPMAIEIVTTTTLALGSKELSVHGAIVTRLAAIEDMAGMAILCSDKTGTLTLNEMVIQEDTPVYSAGETQYSLLRYAAMAAKWKEPARDALDRLTLGAVDIPSLDSIEQLDYMPFDPIVKRTESTVRDTKSPDSSPFKVTKGAPHVILKLCQDDAKNNSRSSSMVTTTEAVEKDVQSLGQRGIRAIAVAKTDATTGAWVILGLLTFLDPPRPDSAATIEQAKQYGVAVKMITGDHLLIAKETARVLHLGPTVRDAQGLPLLDEHTKQKPDNLARDYGDLCVACDGFAQVFPEHKYLIVECLRELGYKVGMTGDGVNDAPALKRADVGVAVHGATDAARAAADIVLTQPGLSTIVEGIIISRRIWSRIRNFLTYRIAATLQLVSFFFMAVFIFRPRDYMPNDWETDPDFKDDSEWPVFFHMPVLMLMLITLLNDGTLITIGYDHAVAEQTPPRWNMPLLFSTAAVQAFVCMVSSLLLTYFLLDSWRPGSLMRDLGIGGLSYGKVTTAIYLKVSISDFLTLFSARAGGDWFWSVPPANILLTGACAALTASTLIAMFWPKSKPDGVPTEGLDDSKPYDLVVYVWLWSLAWWLVMDAAKVGWNWWVYKNNYFDVQRTGEMRVSKEAAAKYSMLPVEEGKEVLH